MVKIGGAVLALLVAVVLLLNFMGAFSGSGGPTQLTAEEQAARQKAVDAAAEAEKEIKAAGGTTIGG
jgi:Na+-transporting methylmalonyl-CoA/oxaloacetate decarboxylase gamma subunit